MPLRHVIVIQLTALPQWLRLSRPARQKVIDSQVTPALEAHPDCQVRWVDVEAMTGACSDVILAETDDLQAWSHLWERLRDSDLFAHPYFRLESILAGFEDGYLDYEATLDA